MDLAIEDCVKCGIQAKFLQRHRAEVIKVSLYEFNIDKILEMEHRDAYEEGREEGTNTVFTIQQDLIEGHSPEEIARTRDLPLDLILKAMKYVKK